MNKALFASLIAVLFLTPALALDDLGARPMGMGGAFVGVADDVNSIFVNPAGAASIAKEGVLVSTRLETGRELTLIGGVEQTPLGSIGIGYVGSSDQIGVDLTGVQGDTTTKTTSQTLYVTLAQDVNRRIKVPKGMGYLSLGVNLKFSSRKAALANGLTADRGSAVDMDIATVFKPNDDLSFGLSMQNFINGKTTQNGVSPATGEAVAALQAGVSGKLFDSSLTWSVQENSQGCEWRPAKGLSLRAGRNANDFTSGFGLNLNGFNVDYAFAGGADPTHYWSVSIMPQQQEAKAVVIAETNEPTAESSASVMPDAYHF